MRTAILAILLLIPLVAAAEADDRTYRIQKMLDGSTAIFEVRGEAVRRVDARHHTYLRWLATGKRPSVLPAQAPTPKQKIRSDQLRQMVFDATRPQMIDLLTCHSEASAAASLGSMVAPDCTPLAEAWQVAREQAEDALRGRYEVVR
jgi:hypothetical protein